MFPHRQELAINRLADETSPYLLQHADNPVDWFPWGDEAFEEARRRDVPVFLSVGYSSCHWCHVMAHESFEDAQMAEVLNENFVSVKVDREERPDVDAVYMDAVTALTGRGGWPMSVFLDHERRPFYAGTYWPKERRGGMPGFDEVLGAVTDAWEEKRDELAEQATKLVDGLAQQAAAEQASGDLDLTVSDEAVRVLVDHAWDRQLGGFGRAPKFPQAMTIGFLLDHHARTGLPEALEAAVHSLDAMARGGINDQIGGGFARYSTDARWLVPHFEKMLYDNALLLSAYARGAGLSGRADLARVAAETADYLTSEMRHPDGGFYSATDADSEGVEGKFFTWSIDELVQALAEAGLDEKRWVEFFGASVPGNWEGTNILHEPVPRDDFARQHDLDPEAFSAELRMVRDALYRRRATRIPPALDDKVLTSWNALAIRGFVASATLLDRPQDLAVAQECADFLDRELVVDGVLHHTWKDGVAAVPAFLEDVAALAAANLDLYAATGVERHFVRARSLAEEAVERFHDDERGGYFQTAHDAEQLYRRPKDTWDNATPSSNSLMAELCVRLAAYTGDAVWRERAEEIVALFTDGMRRSAPGYGYLLQTVEALRGGPREVAIVGPDDPGRAALVGVAVGSVRPGTVVAVGSGTSDTTVPLLRGRTTRNGSATAYVCRDFVCEQPVTTVDELEEQLRA